MGIVSRAPSHLVLLAYFLLSVSGLRVGASGLTAGPALPVPHLSCPNALLPEADKRIVHAPARRDANNNRVDDGLEERYGREGKAGVQPADAPPVVDLLICLDHSPTPADLAHYQGLGGTALESWRDLIYALRVRFPATRLPPAALEKLGMRSGVTWVEENAVMHADGFFAGRQTRVRTAWRMGLVGDPNQTLVVCDSGIDGSHPDFAGRIIAWQDFAGPDVSSSARYLTPTDGLGHGSAVAGLAAGSGAMAGTSSGMGVLNLTLATPLYSFLFGQTFPVDTTANSGLSTLTARLKWPTALPGMTHRVQLNRDSLTGAAVLADASTPATANQPFVLPSSTIPAGVSSFSYRALAGTSAGAPATPLPAWLQVSTPMSAVGDGFPLMRGAAGGCKLIGLKVLDDKGVGNGSGTLNAMTWVNSNRRSFNIVCVTTSLGYSAPSAALDAAVDQLVSAGVVWVNSAGNNRDAERDLEAAGKTFGIFAIASAAKVLTVGATNDRDRVTTYSSYGRQDQSKPDVLAPGGSNFTGRLLVGVDTNAMDNLGSSASAAADQFPDDYRIIGAGTSFATPQVAGAVMLVAQALGNWTHTEAQALQVKSLILMTASETGGNAEPLARDPLGQRLPLPPDPELNRGGRDRAEGYGRLNADAAVEAVTQSLAIGSSQIVTLGADVTDKKVWARNVVLGAGSTYSFTLTNPPDADYDLYLYSGTPVSLAGSDGEPQLVASSTRSALGGTEDLAFTPAASGTFYVVVKYVAGAGGTFQLANTTAAVAAVP